MGPVLLKQDKTEAVMAVNGRLEFIEKEMYAFILFRWPIWWLSDKMQADMSPLHIANGLKLR